MEKILCACGCGQYFIPKCKKTKYILGHHLHGKATIDYRKYVMPEFKKCKKCKRVKSIKKFFLRRYVSKVTNEAYYRPRECCINCSYIRIQHYFQTPEGKLARIKSKNKQGSITRWLMCRMNSWKKKDKDCNLTVPYLVKLYEQQNGLCYYTGEKMIFPIGKLSMDGISLDKLVPKNGYKQGNVVFCTYRVNSMKSTYTETEFYKKIEKILYLHNCRHSDYSI